MKRVLFILLLLQALSQIAWATDPLIGSVPAGKAKSQTCAACHGADGNSVTPNWPKLAGQYQNYLAKQLKDYQMGEEGPRYDPSMSALVADLTEQDIADLAAFYAQQTQTMGKAEQSYVALGERIYRGGNLATGVSACQACHGPSGLGNEAADFPKLAGQHAQYLSDQLQRFKEGKRRNSPSGMMGTISHHLSDQEIVAVSSFIEGLRNETDEK